MFRLTREVRFAIDASSDAQLSGKPTNSYAGFPSLTGLGRFYVLRVTLAGELDLSSQYVVNIRDIDAVARAHAVPLVTAHARAELHRQSNAAQLTLDLFRDLAPRWPGRRVECVELGLSPYLRYAVHASEHPMVRLSQKFEFSATHRLHNPALSDEANCQTFGKCNNPHGHGHNYEVQVTLAGHPNDSGLLIDIPAFERIVATTVIDRFDHKNLNLELPEFRELIPSVENIAMTIHRLLKPALANAGAKLAAVTVWETPKTWCEYSE